MLLFDVNVLIRSADRHYAEQAAYERWLTDVLASDEPYGVADVVLSGFLRIVTNPKISKQPMDLASALEFVSSLRSQPNCVTVNPGPRHWEIFVDLCRKVAARGNLIPDAYLAALAIESGCEWITTDRDYARFPALRWRHPLDS